jgi:hypothetical protein
LAAPEGAPVYAAAAGHVSALVERPGTVGFRGYGRAVVLHHELAGLGHVWTLYAHLSSIDSRLRVGDSVSEGQLIGRVGRTCDTRADASHRCGGAHLHFELSPSSYPQQSEAPRLDPTRIFNEDDMTEPTPQQRLSYFDRLWQRLFTAAPASVRNADNAFTRAVREWRVWLDDAMASPQAALLAIGAPQLGPMIVAYNAQRSAAEGSADQPPEAKGWWERNITDPARAISRDVANYASSAAWGIGGVVLILGGLWLWSSGRGRG